MLAGVMENTSQAPSCVAVREADKKDPKIEHKKAALVNDARTNDSIIDCEALLDQFEASDPANSDQKTQKVSKTKLLDLRSLCGHPLEVHRGDLESLQGRKFVTEGVVEYYLDLLHRQMDIRAQKDVHILSSATFPTLKRRLENGNERLLHIEENIFNKKHIIFPICFNEHWVIAVATRFKHYTMFLIISRIA